MMIRIKWHFLRISERLGILGLLIIVASLFGLVFILASWLPARITHNAMMISKQENTAKISILVESPGEKLQQFLAHLPKTPERAKHIQSIMSKAKILDLVLDDVTYKTERHPNNPLSKTCIDFTLNSTYPEMRALLNSVLTDMPFVSLDQLSINRNDTESDLLVIRMRLTLHFMT